MKKKVYVVVFLVMSLIGLSYETQVYTGASLTGQDYGIIGSAILLTLIYILPALFVVAYLRKKWQVSTPALVLASIGGLFLSGWLSSYGNEYASQFLKFFVSKDTAELLSGIVVAPLVEEGFKLLPLFFILQLVEKQSWKSYLLLGAIAGLGFQILEDYAYIQVYLPEGFASTISGTLGRIFTAHSSHWLYTAIATVGVVLYVHYRKSNPAYARLGILYVLADLGLHALWNSPLTDVEWELPLPASLISTAGFLVLYHVYQTVSRLDIEEERK